mgnify:CR=1 FL=1
MTNLIKGHKYPEVLTAEYVESIEWTDKEGNEIDAPEGYNFLDYFDASGEFRGADVDGIAPVQFSIDS